MIHVKKVMEHVYEKIVLSDNGNNSNNSEKMPPEELSTLAEAKVEIHCNDMVSLSSPFNILFLHSLVDPLQHL